MIAADAHPTNGAEVAIEADSLRKDYRLGQLVSMTLAVGSLLGRTRESPCLEALHDVSFTVRRGETFGLVGTNGSGKSTIMHVLAGITVPTAGTMTVRGRVLPLLSVGSGFHPELTGRENVVLFGTILGITRETIDARMDDILAFADVEQHADTPVKRYSDGMQARLSFAIAMRFPADIYVFDEVLAVVDGDFRALCIDQIRRLREDQRTVLYVSHDLEQVSDVCDQVLWLEKGRLQMIGDAEPVLEAYAQSGGQHS